MKSPTKEPLRYNWRGHLVSEHERDDQGTVLAIIAFLVVVASVTIWAIHS